jgi:hypothetical protein
LKVKKWRPGLALLAAIVIVVSVLSYFALYQPTVNRTATQSALKTFFASCQLQTDCLTSTDLTIGLANSSQAPTSEQELIGLLNQLLQNSSKFNKQLTRALGVAWQNQPGTLSDEWQIVSQSLTQSQESITGVQEALARQENYLTALTDLATINDFQTRLSQFNSDLQSLKRYLPLLQTIASEETMPISLLLFDNTIARTGGGEVLGYLNLALTNGKLGAMSAQPMSEVIAAASLEVKTPTVLSDYQATGLEAQGAYNLALARDFNASSVLATQLLESAGGVKPIMTASFNLNVLAALEAAANHQEPETTLNTLRRDLRAVTLSSKEKTLISHLNALHGSLNAFDSATLSKIFFAFLTQLNSGEMVFFSARDDLAVMLASSGVIGDPANVLCPAGFGTELCFLDTLAQTDDYLDANVDLLQTVTHTVELEAERTVHTRKVVFNNAAGKRTAADYVSFKLPVGASFESLTVDGEKVAFDSDKSLLVTVEAGATTTLELVAFVTRTINQNDLTYSFYNQYQSGFLAQTLQVIIVNKLPYSPKIIAPYAVSEQKNIIFNPVTRQNFQGAIVF